MIHEEEDTEDAEDVRDVKQAREAKHPDEEILKEEARPSSSAPLSDETQAAAWIPGDRDMPLRMPAPEINDARQTAAANSTPSDGSVAPLETILGMPPPETAEQTNAAKPPHLQTPPYVHHFDTYTLVQQVQDGGFTEEQAITSMKAVRGLLALNLGVAKEGLVSKSDVENVSQCTLDEGGKEQAANVRAGVLFISSSLLRTQDRDPKQSQEERGSDAQGTNLVTA